MPGFLFAPKLLTDRDSFGKCGGMTTCANPFIGSEALVAGVVSRYELRRQYRAIMPNVYLPKRVDPALGQRTAAAWLWSARAAVVAGIAASALHVPSGSTTTRRWS